MDWTSKSVVYEIIKTIKSGTDMKYRQVSGKQRKIPGNSLNALVVLRQQNPRQGFWKPTDFDQRIRICPNTVRMAQGYISRKPKLSLQKHV